MLEIEDALVVIPGVTAFHVLNEQEVILGSGELILLPASSAERDLTLAVDVTEIRIPEAVPIDIVQHSLKVFRVH